MTALDAPTAPMPRFASTFGTVAPPARTHGSTCGARESYESGLSGLICTAPRGHRGGHAAHGRDGRTLRTWGESQ